MLNVICLQKKKNSQYSFEPKFINIMEDIECHLYVKTHNILLRKVIPFNSLANLPKSPYFVELLYKIEI